MSRLFKNVMILFLLLFLVVSFVISQVVQSYFVEKNEDWQLDKLESQMITLESQLDQADFFTLQELLEAVQPTAESIQQDLAVFNLQGQGLYHSNEQLDPLHSEKLNHLLNQPDHIIRQTKLDPTSDEHKFYVSCLIEDGQGEPLAVLSLADQNNERAVGADTVQIYTLLFTLGSLLLLGVYLTYWTRSITKPLGEIKMVADQLAEKNYGSRYRGHHSKEIDQLGYSINKLASKLEFQVKELESRNEQLFHLIENLNIGIILLDENRRIKIVNPAMSQLLELNVSNYINRPYIHIIKNPWIIELIEKAFESNQTQSKEIVLENSEEYILDTNIIPIHLSQESDFGLIVIFYDITEIRRLEKVRTDFVSNASHELRTPVTALKGFTETLLDGAMDDRETLVYFLKIMQDESERLDSIVGDILQLSRLEQKPDQLTEEKVNVKDITLSVFDVLKQSAENKDIDLKLDLIDDVDINYYKDSLKQILMNLVNNAILYNHEGGYVEVQIEDMGEEVRISVNDNGIGIKEQEQKRIFERFYRVDKARSRNAGGTGLGLSIVRHMVENSSGRLVVDSVYGKGSSFTVYLKKG